MYTNEIMNRNEYAEDVRDYIDTLCKDEDLHILILEGLAGWGKTTCIKEAVELLGGLHNIQQIGAYSTPLMLYNSLCKHSNKTVLMDDCSGMFNDPKAMAQLKNATWPGIDGKRSISWESSSTKIQVQEHEFTGKIIIVCNEFPTTQDGNAVRSRSISKILNVTVESAIKMLIEGARNPKYFPNTKVAVEVSEFLIGKITNKNLTKINFRTLITGYKLALNFPDPIKWKRLFAGTLPISTDESPVEIVKELAERNLKVGEQVKIFRERTGLQERSFFNYRKELNISWRMKN